MDSSSLVVFHIIWFRSIWWNLTE